jgi:hypothetical protein
MSPTTSNQAKSAAPPPPSGEDRPLELDLDEIAERQLIARMLSRDYDDWSQALSRVGFSPTRSAWSAGQKRSTPPGPGWTRMARRTRRWG